MKRKFDVEGQEYLAEYPFTFKQPQLEIFMGEKFGGDSSMGPRFCFSFVTQEFKDFLKNELVPNDSDMMLLKQIQIKYKIDNLTVDAKSYVDAQQGIAAVFCKHMFTTHLTNSLGTTTEYPLKSNYWSGKDLILKKPLEKPEHGFGRYSVSLKEAWQEKILEPNDTILVHLDPFPSLNPFDKREKYDDWDLIFYSFQTFDYTRNTMLMKKYEQVFKKQFILRIVKGY